MSKRDYYTTLGVNLRGCFFAIKHAARQMVKQGPQGDWGAGKMSHTPLLSCSVASSIRAAANLARSGC